MTFLNFHLTGGGFFCYQKDDGFTKTCGADLFEIGAAKGLSRGDFLTGLDHRLKSSLKMHRIDSVVHQKIADL